VKWRGWLADRLAPAARHLFAYGLDHLPAARDHLERLGHVFADARQPVRAAARAAGGCRDDDALARQVRWKGLTRRALANEGRDIGLRRRERGEVLVFGRGRFRLLEGELDLVDQPLAALRALAVELTTHLLVLERQQRVARDEVGGLRD